MKWLIFPLKKQLILYLSLVSLCLKTSHENKELFFKNVHMNDTKLKHFISAFH